MEESDSIQFDFADTGAKPGLRWLKRAFVVVPVFLLGMLVMHANELYENEYVTLHTTSAMRGLAIEGMRIHRLDSSPDSLKRLSDLPTCHGFPITQTKDIEKPSEASLIWSSLIESGVEKPGRRTKRKDFFPDWAVEIDNGERIRTVLIATKDDIMIFVADSQWYFHGLSSFPMDTFKSVFQGDYGEMPELKPVPTPAPVEPGVIKFEYKSLGSPSWPESIPDN